MELNPPTFAEDIKKSGCAIVFNALHGKFGEDGVLQGTLDMLGIPYTGSGVLAAAVTMDKAASKRVFVAEGISTPRSHTYYRYEMKRDLAAEIEQGFSLPVVVKAASQGSSIGVYIVETKDALEDALKEAFSYNDEVLVEEFIRARSSRSPSGAMRRRKRRSQSSRSRRLRAAMTTRASTRRVLRRTSSRLASLRKTKEIQDLAIKTFTACGCKGLPASI